MADAEVPAAQEIARIIALDFGQAIGSDPLDAEESFFAAGGHSLLLPAVARRLSNRLGVDVPLEAILENPTAAGLAEHALRRMRGEVDDLESVREEHDLARRDLSMPARAVAGSRSETTRGTVFLTGATGFVGAAIARALLRSTGYELICLTRPRDQPGDPLDKAIRDLTLTAPGRIRLVAGDLTSELLGLDDEELDATFSRADWIVHCAARVSVLERYGRLRATNVRGTATLAGLAARYGAKLLYVSTTPPTATALRGYVLSKIVGEQLVARAATDGPVIVRLPRIVSARGETDWQPHDLVRRMIAGSVRVGAFPWPADGEGWREHWVARDQAGTTIAELISAPAAHEGPTICQLSSTREVSHVNVHRWLGAAGVDLEKVTPSVWLSMVLQQLDNEAAPIAGALVSALNSRPDSEAGLARVGEDTSGLVLADPPTESRSLEGDAAQTIRLLVRELQLEQEQGPLVRDGGAAR
jgi:thioester reductase-like protein